MTRCVFCFSAFGLLIGCYAEQTEASAREIENKRLCSELGEIADAIQPLLRSREPLGLRLERSGGSMSVSVDQEGRCFADYTFKHVVGNSPAPIKGVQNETWSLLITRTDFFIPKSIDEAKELEKNIEGVRNYLKERFSQRNIASVGLTRDLGAVHLEGLVPSPVDE